MPCDLSQLSQLVSGESGFEPASPQSSSYLSLPLYLLVGHSGLFFIIILYCYSQGWD